MTRTWKQIGSLLLSVCMVMTMLPAVAFAEGGAKDSGALPGTGDRITAFAALDADIALQTVEPGTEENELNLPAELTVTVTKTVTTTTGSAVTDMVSGNDIATDSEAQERDEKTETQEIQKETTVTVSGWTSDPAYSPEYDAEGNNTYVFTPALELPEGLTLAKDVRAPVISVDIQPKAGRGMMRLAAGYDLIVQGNAGADGSAGGGDGVDNTQTYDDNDDTEWRNVTVTGGNGGIGIPGGTPGGKGGKAEVSLSASTITGDINIVSGNGGDTNRPSSINEDSGTGGDARLTLTAPVVTVSGGILVKTGDDGDDGGVWCGTPFLYVEKTLHTLSLAVESTNAGDYKVFVNTLEVSEDTEITVNAGMGGFINCTLRTVNIADGKTLTINNANGKLYIGTINFIGSGTGQVVIADSGNLGMDSLNFFHKAAYDIPESAVGTAIADIDVSDGVVGGGTSYSYSASGLPAGIGIDSATGVISGTPTTAGAAGTATITVTDRYQSSKSIAVNYGAVTGGSSGNTVSVTGVTLNKTRVSLYSNITPRTAALTATVSPANATDKSVNWASGNTDVAKVDQNGNVSSVGNGTAVITVMTTDGGYTASCTVTVSNYNSGGSGSSSGGSSPSGGLSTGTTSQGTITTDSRKGQVNSVTGIITGSGSGHSQWQTETKADGSTSWKLEYADGTTAAGSMITREDGTTYEQPAWEMVNGAWYPFGADGYVKNGFVNDPALGGVFYNAPNTGMKTGWQMIEGNWYYFNPYSDGKKGIMFADTMVDGYYVDKNGIWNGEARKE